MEKALEVSRNIWKAMQLEDTKVLKENIDKDAMFIHMGVSLDRDDEIEVIKNRRIVYHTINFEESLIKEFDDTIIVYTKLKLTAIVEGKEVVNPFIVTEVYNKDLKMLSMSYTRINY